MNHLIAETEDPGIAKAWLMATVGTRPVHYRTLRRDLKDISIPKICDEVSTIAAKARHLRITSNLLYGLSLIYKQKVTFMAADLSTIFDRISSPLFVKDPQPKACIRPENQLSAKRKFEYLQSNSYFEMNVDFVPADIDLLSDGDQASERYLKYIGIREQDQHIFGQTAKGELPAYVAAEAQDKSFLEFLNRTMNTKEVSLEECLAVDFEFDQDGEIIGQQEIAENVNDTDFLRDLNLDEDFHTVSATVEDITKNLNSTERIAQLDQAQATINELPTGARVKKKRKIKTICDEVTTLGLASLPLDGSSSILTPIPIPDVLHFLSMTQPPFLNMCYRMIFGPSVTGSMSATQLPSSSRHPYTTNLDSFLKDIDDIERGRNLPSKRPSSSLADDIYESPFRTPTEEAPLDGLDLNLDPLSPMLDDLYEDKIADRRNESHRIEDFEDFLHERAAHITREHAQRSDVLTMELLVPSTSSQGEESVQRSLAASAFACLLQLASSGSISIKAEPSEDSRPSQPNEVYIAFN